MLHHKKRTSIYKEDTHFVKGKEGKRWFNNRQKKKCWSSLLKPKAFSEEQSSSCSWGYLLCIVWVDYILVYQRPIYVPLCDKILKIVHTLRLGDNSNGWSLSHWAWQNISLFKSLDFARKFCGFSKFKESLVILQGKISNFAIECILKSTSTRWKNVHNHYAVHTLRIKIQKAPTAIDLPALTWVYIHSFIL